MPAGPEPYPLSVEQYQEIAARGIIPSGAPVELIDGQLVRKMTKSEPHITCCEILNIWLMRRLPDGWYASVENPLVLADVRSEPEPDLKVVSGTPRDYLARKARPEDVALVIEVSDTSYSFDRKVKARLYAASGVPVLWLVDLNRRVLEVHTGPGPEGYGQIAELAEADEVILTLGGREVARVAVRDLLP
jgi:Uma2 family endonuclease